MRMSVLFLSGAAAIALSGLAGPMDVFAQNAGNPSVKGEPETITIPSGGISGLLQITQDGGCPGDVNIPSYSNFLDYTRSGPVPAYAQGEDDGNYLHPGDELPECSPQMEQSQK